MKVWALTKKTMLKLFNGTVVSKLAHLMKRGWLALHYLRACNKFNGKIWAEITSHQELFLNLHCRHMSKIKIGIVDDHQAIAQGLSFELTKTNCMRLFSSSPKRKILDTLSEKYRCFVNGCDHAWLAGIETFKEV